MCNIYRPKQNSTENSPRTIKLSWLKKEGGKKSMTLRTLCKQHAQESFGLGSFTVTWLK